MQRVVWKTALIVCTFLLSLIIACAKPPTQEIANAEKAIADAKSKEADLYAQDVFEKAEDEMRRVNDLVAAKKYTEAKTAAVEATKMAQQAAALVEQNKQKMKLEIEAMLPEIQKEMEELKSLATAAIKGKAVSSKDDVYSIIGKLELDMTNVKEQMELGHIHQASDLAKSVSEQIKARNQEMTLALARQKTAGK